MMDYSVGAILERNEVGTKLRTGGRRKPRKNQWVYHYDDKDAVVAVKLYGVEKLIGKVVRTASKACAPDRTWYFVNPIFAYGKVDATKSRWFGNDKVRVICRPIKIYQGVAIKQKTNCNDCKFRFACWTQR